MRWLLKSRAGALRAFFHSSLKQTHRDDLGTSRPVWPMPLPFLSQRGGGSFWQCSFSFAEGFDIYGYLHELAASRPTLQDPGALQPCCQIDR